MIQKQKKVLVRLDVLEIILSIVGFITCLMVFAFTRMNERFFFFAVALVLGMNIIHSMRVLTKRTEKPRVLKYSKKIIGEKSLEKVSY